MSIASNVITTNERLTVIRDELREILTHHGIVYYSDDDVFTLARRAWFLIYPTNGSCGGSYSDCTVQGKPLDLKVDQQSDNDEDIHDGAVADFFISVNGGDEIHVKGVFENGSAGCPYIAENNGDNISVRALVNEVEGITTEMEVIPFKYEDSYEVTMDDYTLIKYPSSANITVSEVDEFSSDYDYVNGVEVSKTYGTAQAAYMIPTGLTDGIDLTETGIHFSAIVSPMYSSASGWASGICLLSSKDLTHYRDTTILELGAYPGKKGLKYSGTNHTITEINTTAGQLKINGTFKFDLYYDNGYVKATITDQYGSTTYYSYESSSISIMNKVFPAFMIYDYGGKIRFRETEIEPWRNLNE